MNTVLRNSNKCYAIPHSIYFISPITTSNAKIFHICTILASYGIEDTGQIIFIIIEAWASLNNGQNLSLSICTTPYAKYLKLWNFVHALVHINENAVKETKVKWNLMIVAMTRNFGALMSSLECSLEILHFQNESRCGKLQNFLNSDWPIYFIIL